MDHSDVLAGTYKSSAELSSLQAARSGLMSRELTTGEEGCVLFRNMLTWLLKRSCESNHLMCATHSGLLYMATMLQTPP